ncbi:protein-export chaperone SecB [Bartonella quintana]|uniref:Protein-export protein SecB n=3 Tax=Bartonella quintana TaxID=803 RepID=SECB_BARQU|nr:protein-export chaperone SecB [Bartonella quintana]Q6G0W9.1 RecName: Full=Protein-export protein SecB [Bartonella quintana str. Toulouse]ETS13588.1 protein-export protein secB [Bartonella quintana BQ2-D70]ETS14974.1 protein-export protein secB [Bartonella quintana JK 73rel]ETS16814.1 protein-export protein secB [Bartonella quintana JK 73]ETS17061.1 protein-export protein secB [Bartonella quintana JK 12]ETS19356.1 protein-export protein secB [Bartonella quintana JK 7]
MVKSEINNNGGEPVFAVLTQYLKDFSFENPSAPRSLRPREKAPQIDININVNANPIGDDNYDVVLSLSVKANDNNETLFHVELIYGGVFHIKDIPQEHIMPLVFIECPRLLFPFARQIISDATQNGGFPPLWIDPIDFAALFQKRVAEEQKNSQTQPS